MITVHVPDDLARQFHMAPVARVTASDLGALVQSLDRLRPGVASWLTDDGGRFREHLSVFVGGRRLPKHAPLSTLIPADAEVYVLRAVSGG